MIGEAKKEETLAPDPAKTTNAELHAHFNHLLVERVQDVDNQIVAALEKIDRLEEAFNTKLDTKFQEVLDRLPVPVAQPAPQPATAPGPHDPHARGRARRVPLANQRAAPINLMLHSMDIAVSTRILRRTNDLLVDVRNTTTAMLDHRRFLIMII